MKRSTTNPIEAPQAIVDNTQEPIIISKFTLDMLLKMENPADCIALYTFYYYTAKWQKTNQIKATNAYCMSGLSLGEYRFFRAKKQIKEAGLIQDIKWIDAKTKKAKGWFVRVNFIWTEEAIKKVMKPLILEVTDSHNPDIRGMGKATTLVSHRLANQATNALSVYNKNALSENTLCEDEDGKTPKGLNGKKQKQSSSKLNGYITPKQFEKFYKAYPRKVDKGKALSAWLKLCNRKDKKYTPTLAQILKALKLQKKTKRWQTKKFIPHPTTYLNNTRWLDEIEEEDLIDDNKKGNRLSNESKSILKEKTVSANSIQKHTPEGVAS